MKIYQEVKDFLSENRHLINAFDFRTLYELASRKGNISISQMTYIFYNAGINPLQYMNFVPSLFARDLDLPNPIIDIPDHIESIHPRAFERTNATKFIAPVNLKNIPKLPGNSIFSSCSDLTEADFSKCDLYEEIDMWMFEDCPNLKVIKFPKNLRSIRFAAFAECEGLTSIDLSNCHKLTNIETAVFEHCHNLTTIYLPNSIKHIAVKAFNTGKPITIIFDGTQQEWDDKFGDRAAISDWNTSTIDIQYLR